VLFTSRRFTLPALLVCVFATPVLMRAQQPATGTAAVRTAAEQFKNVHVLRDIPANQMNPTMHLIAGQLGVGCQFCHVWEQWDKEDRPQKQIARRMMTMTADLNKNAFGGAPVVTCYTCHRGQPKPVAMVALPVARPPAHDAPPAPAAVLPSVDEVLNKYVQALGGQAALRKITSRVIVGRRDIPTGPGGLVPMAADVEMYQKAPNLTMNVYRTEKFVIADGFDGSGAWTQTIAGAVNDVPNPDAGRVRRMANFYEPIELRNDYRSMDVEGIDTVGTRRAYVLVGRPDGDTPERLYFDAQSGLLLRRAFYLTTAAGPSPFQIDFDDYRASGGVKMPFLIRMDPAGQRTELGTMSTLRITKVQNNVALDAGRFVRPEPRTRPATR
jgi:hypothetical protein